MSKKSDNEKRYQKPINESRGQAFMSVFLSLIAKQLHEQCDDGA